MKLEVKNLHYLGKSKKEKKYDLCVHGNVFFEIDGDVICDLKDTWCVSASAYRFMKSLKEDHWCDHNQMIPCCGGFMIPSDDNTNVIITSCEFGIDFDVIREDDNIKIMTDDKDYVVSFDEYKRVISRFVNEVEKFYLESDKKIFWSDFERSGHSAFITEWHLLKKELNIDKLDIDSNSCKDYIDINENDIIGINRFGITFNNFMFFEFDTFTTKDLDKNSNNIAEEPIGDIFTSGNYSIVIYGKVYNKDIELNISFNIEKELKKLIAKNRALDRFYKIVSKIESFGYKLREIS